MRLSKSSCLWSSGSRPASPRCTLSPGCLCPPPTASSSSSAPPTKPSSFSSGGQAQRVFLYLRVAALPRRAENSYRHIEGSFFFAIYQGVEFLRHTNGIFQWKSAQRWRHDWFEKVSLYFTTVALGGLTIHFFGIREEVAHTQKKSSSVELLVLHT